MKPFNYKKIGATELQEICALMDTHKDVSSLPQRPELPRSSPSKLGSIGYCIKKFGLEKNITLQTISDSPSSEPKISGVTFRNLKIKGEVKIRFSHFKKIEFLNNEFSDDVTITLLGVTIKNLLNTTAIFNENHFSKSVDIYCTHATFEIENNDISRKMSISFNFTSLFNDPDYHKTKNIFFGATATRLFMRFSANKINYLSINDISDLSKWNLPDHDYPLEIIEFAGDNRIKVMMLSTKHITLYTHVQLKADVNRISFKTSDKIGISTPKTVPTDNDIEFPPFFLSDYYQLMYGRFFSLLEKQASEQCDSENEDIYRRKVRYFKKKFSFRWEDRVICGWTNLASRDGTSWLIPIAWLTGTETLLAGITYYFLVGWDLCYLWEEGWKIFLTLFAWFMNPASLLPLPAPSGAMSDTITKITESWLIYFLFLFQKLFAAIFYYEIIKVLRRFTK